MDNKEWALIGGGVIAFAVVAYQKSRPRELTQDEYEAVRPAPISTLERDPFPLTPDYLINRGSPLDNEGYVTESAPVSANPYFPGARQTLPLIYARPSSEQINSPQNPAGLTLPTLSNKVAQMRLGTANIKNFPDMPKAKVAADARKIGALCTIWGGQEIEPGEDTQVVLNALGSNWDAVFKGRETPIFFRKDKWRVKDLHEHFNDRGNLPNTQKDSSSTSAAFESINRPELPDFAIVNTHLINPRGKPEWIKRWPKEFKGYRNVIQYHHAKGRDVFFVGDTNNPACPIPFQGARWLHNAGIDKIGYFPAGQKIMKIQTSGNPSGEIHALNSDHRLKVVNVKLNRR